MLSVEGVESRRKPCSQYKLLIVDVAREDGDTMVSSTTMCGCGPDNDGGIGQCISGSRVVTWIM